MRVSAIDIGTNTILHLVADVDAAGIARVVHDGQAIARIGKSVDASRRIARDAFERCAPILCAARETAERLGADRIIAAGTSALRDAANNREFIDAMWDASGIAIEIIGGAREAALTFAGAISGIEAPEDDFAVIDIGGGSTEVVVGTRSGIRDAASRDIGCVRLTERCFSQLPPAPPEIDAFRSIVRGQLPSYPEFDASTTTLVAVAGTATTLAAIDLGLTAYDGTAIAGHILTIERVRRFARDFSRMNAAELHERLAVDPGRADIILAGVLILETFMDERGIARVLVSERGLRYGLALDAFSS